MTRPCVEGCSKWHGYGAHPEEQGEVARAEELRQANLQLLLEPTSRFAEYLEPYTAEPLGSVDQSWTAAVALDWLAQDKPKP